MQDNVAEKLKSMLDKALALGLKICDVLEEEDIYTTMKPIEVIVALVLVAHGVCDASNMNPRELNRINDSLVTLGVYTEEER